MKNKKAIEMLIRDSKPDMEWIEEEKERKQNEAWQDISFAIAVKILRRLRELKLTQKELADKLEVSPQYMNKVVKGKENLTLETIAKIQMVLKISLFEVPAFESTMRYNFLLPPPW